MPLQKIDSVPQSSAKENKKPTLLQYLKKTEEENLKEHYLLNKVWFPGKFNNITLETENFRALVYPHQEEYQAILDFLNEYFMQDDYLLYISLEDTVDGDWCFSCNYDEVAHWRTVDNIGLCELEKVSRRKKAKTQSKAPKEPKVEPQEVKN